MTAGTIMKSVHQPGKNSVKCQTSKTFPIITDCRHYQQNAYNYVG